MQLAVEPQRVVGARRVLHVDPHEDPARRGATLAVHSMLGYAGGFVGPLMIGVILDLGGGMSRAAWGAAFLAVAVLMLLALAAFWLIRPRELAGDRGGQ